MAENALSPAFIQINYHSVHGSHVMTRQTTAWTPPAGGFAHGSFLNHDGIARDADDMIKDFVNLLAPKYATNAGFDNYIIYTQVDESSPPLIADLGDLSIAGTEADTGQDKASQATYSFLDTEGKKVKLVLLDYVNLVGYEPIGAYGDLSADEQAIVGAFINSANAWASRNDKKPQLFRRASFTLNDGLRRAYKMT